MRILRKHLFALLPIVLLALFLTPAVAFGQTGTYVFDDVNKLTSSQFDELESQGADYEKTYNVGVHFLFTDHMSGDESSKSGRNEYGRSVIVSKGLDKRDNKGCILFVVAVNSRKYVTVKYFPNKADDPFSDDGVDDLEDDVKSELKNDEWYEAASQYYTTVGKQLEYFAKNGKQWTSPDVITLLVKVLATIAIPLLIAFGIVRSEKNAMLTARTQSAAANYADPDGLDLRISTDTFVDRHLAVVPLPKHSDSDSDSGGGWSDMGGGFSGSGGGDF